MKDLYDTDSQTLRWAVLKVVDDIDRLRYTVSYSDYLFFQSRVLKMYKSFTRGLGNGMPKRFLRSCNREWLRRQV